MGQAEGEETFDEVVEVSPVEDGGRADELIERAAASGRKARVVADGRFLVGVRGRLERVADQQWEVVIENSAALGIDSTRMVMHPSARLMEMGRIASGRSHGVGFEINGQVFLYKGKNYLLAMSFEVLRVDSQGRLPEESEIAPAPGDGLAVEGTDVDSMLKSLSPREREVMEEGVMGREEGVRIAPLREGTMVVSRMGRLVSRIEGGWEFRIDADTDGGADQDPPVTVLPCAMLERIELAVESRPEATRLTVSGSVFVHQGENYLLPAMMLIEPIGEGNLVSAQ